jgi:hypothetical protein
MSFITFQFTDSFFHSPKREILAFRFFVGGKRKLYKVRLLTLTGFFFFFFLVFFSILKKKTTLPIFCLPFVKPGEKAQAKVGWGWGWVGR